MAFIEITDFAAGIHSQASIHKPLGSAVSEGTFGCRSEGGALIPGPQIAQVITLDPDTYTSDTSANFESYGGIYITGIKAIGPIYGPLNTTRNLNLNRSEIMVGLEWHDANYDQMYSVHRYQRGKQTPVWIGMHPYPIGPIVHDLIGPGYGRMTFEYSRNNPDDTEEVGPPVVCTLQYRGTPYMWPDPQNPSIAAAATDEIQHLHLDATSGTYDLTYDGETLSGVDFDETAANITTDLAFNLSNLTAGDVTVTGGPGDAGATTPYIFTFSNTLAGTNVPLFVTDPASLGGVGNANVYGHTIGRAAAAAGEGSGVRIFDSGWLGNTDPNGTVGNVLFPPEELLAYQGRIVLFPLMIYPAGDEVTRNWSNQEVFYWTKENDFTGMDSSHGFFDQVFGTEEPSGFATFASLSADEIFILKRKGGALMIRGDLSTDPTLTNYPNVKSPGFANNKGTRSPVGFVYCCENGGVWAWEGGDTSTPISQTQSPDFWRPVVSRAYQVGATTTAAWGEWVIVPNNFMFDTLNSSWWKYFPNKEDSEWATAETAAIPDEQEFAETYGKGFFHGDQDHNDRWFYACAEFFETADDSVIYEFDQRRRSQYYSWQSHPIVPSSVDRKAEVKAVSLTASGVGLVSVTVHGASGESQTITFEINNEFPTKFVNSIKVHDTHVQILITATGDDWEDTYTAGPIDVDSNLGTAEAPTVYAVGIDVTDSHKAQIKNT